MVCPLCDRARTPAVQQAHLKFQKLENINIFLNQLKAKSIKLVNIGARTSSRGTTSWCSG